jgi:hypothetical protein
MDATALSEAMRENSEAGMPTCPPGEHYWMGGYDGKVCAICMITPEEYVTVGSLRNGFAALAWAGKLAAARMGAR